MLGGGDALNGAERLCQQCATELAVAGVGLTITSTVNHRPESVVAATEGMAERLESAQYNLGEGPCPTSTSLGRPVLHPHLASTGLATWPRFGRAALDAGCASLFAFPLQVGLIRVGALTLYADQPRSLDADELGEALVYAEVALALVLGREQPGADHHEAAELWIGDHLEVHQATGMVAERLGVALVDALLLLRAHAYSHQRSLVDVARDVVARRLYLMQKEDG